MCVCVCVCVCVCKLRKLLDCLICNFCISNNCPLSSKIHNMFYCVLCDVVNVQIHFNFLNEITE